MNPMLAQLFASQPGLLSMLQKMQPTSVQPGGQQPQQATPPLPGLLTQAGYMNGQFGPGNAGQATMGPQPNPTGNLQGPPQIGTLPPGSYASPPAAPTPQARPAWVDAALDSGYRMQEMKAMDWLQQNKQGKAPTYEGGGYNAPPGVVNMAGGRRGGGRGG